MTKGIPSGRYLKARGLVPNEPTPRQRVEREVYFIRAVTLGLIKIGKATNARSRFSKMRTMSPDTLALMGVVLCQQNGLLEEQLHRRFAAHRSHGEWFRPAPEILAYIKENARSPKPQTHWRVERKRPLKRLKLRVAA